MKYILLLIFALFNYKTQIEKSSTIGIALNEKAGAVIRNEKGVFIISGLKAWSEIYLNKKVSVIGNIQFNENKNKDNKKQEFILAPQIYSEYYIISNPKWMLYNK
jgi:hypothetical protein